jgi:hypothetical protein
VGGLGPNGGQSSFPGSRSCGGCAPEDLVHEAPRQTLIAGILHRRGVPIPPVQRQATVWDQPRHRTLKISRDDAILLPRNDQRRTGDIRQDRAVVERREAVEQVQKPLRAPRRREESQVRPGTSLAGNCRLSTVQRDHVPVRVRPAVGEYEVTPGVETCPGVVTSRRAGHRSRACGLTVVWRSVDG